MDSLSYRLGQHVGVFVVQARKTLRAVHPVVSEDETVAEVAVSLKELDATPAMVRKGINLNDWHARNVTVALPHKARRQGRKPQRKRGTLDPLI